MSDELENMYVNALKQLAVQGIAIKRVIKDAKTSTKKKYYLKKAKHNSMKAARLLVKLDRVAPSTLKETKDEPQGTQLTG